MMASMTCLVAEGRLRSPVRTHQCAVTIRLISAETFMDQLQQLPVAWPLDDGFNSDVDARQGNLKRPRHGLGRPCAAKQVNADIACHEVIA